MPLFSQVRRDDDAVRSRGHLRNEIGVRPDVVGARFGNLDEREVVDRDDFARSARGEEIVWHMQNVEVETPGVARQLHGPLPRHGVAPQRNMGEFRIRDARGGGPAVTEDVVLVAGRRDAAQATDDALAVPLVPSLPHPDEMRVDADPQTAPLPRITAGRVSSAIFVSSSSDHSRMYWVSRAITSSKSTVSLRRRTCHRPVIPGLAPRRLKWWLW